MDSISKVERLTMQIMFNILRGTARKAVSSLLCILQRLTNNDVKMMICFRKSGLNELRHYLFHFFFRACIGQVWSQNYETKQMNDIWSSPEFPQVHSCQPFSLKTSGLSSEIYYWSQSRGSLSRCAWESQHLLNTNSISFRLIVEPNLKECCDHTL